MRVGDIPRVKGFCKAIFIIVQVGGVHELGGSILRVKVFCDVVSIMVQERGVPQLE